ncbi:nucleotide sugar dehydrogenase [Bacteroides sp. AN502(2024)]|uniref:nucleotide sugar dehydrogenase n=1 Tax=Bacteroides sp. AN502(2024) TaxID=3160599 RepID=UPI0035196288
MNSDFIIGVIGLGYVGFPLACLFADKYKVIGFDMSRERVDELNAGHDHTAEVTAECHAKALANGLKCTTEWEVLRACNVYIVAVPTPVDDQHHPDLTPLEKASRTVGEVISKGDIVIYESTVYPGATEDFCAPIIEEVSGLKFNSDFFMGYSPERINPGDKDHRVENIRKITSGSTPEIAETIDRLYNSVLLNGTFRASSIKVAEAAKIMENTQRDINIAFMNEMAVVMNAIGIGISEVIEAAGTKWNFLKFQPGLVGGHCIGVDPYYLIDKAKQVGIYPRLTAEARRINEAMGGYVAERIIKCMTLNGKAENNARILLLGFTFKENCPDIRNTKVVEIYKRLAPYTSYIDVLDPWVNPDMAQKEYGIKTVSSIDGLRYSSYDAVVHCVAHDCFRELDFNSLCAEDGGIVFDAKGTLPPPYDKYLNTNKLYDEYNNSNLLQKNEKKQKFNHSDGIGNPGTEKSACSSLAACGHDCLLG